METTWKQFQEENFEFAVSLVACRLSENVASMGGAVLIEVDYSCWWLWLNGNVVRALHGSAVLVTGIGVVIRNNLPGRMAIGAESVCICGADMRASRVFQGEIVLVVRNVLVEFVLFEKDSSSLAIDLFK